MNRSSVYKRTRVTILWFVSAILIIAAVCVTSVITLRQDLYDERAYNSGRVMNKIAANIRTVIKTRMDQVNFDSRVISEKSFANDAEAAAFITKLENISETEEGKNTLLLIDSQGNCLTSDGTLFRWAESGILHTYENHVLVSSINSLGLNDEQMLFVVPLENDVNAGERVFTHVCLVIDQSVVGSYLLQAQYVARSAIFIIHNDGTYLYKQTDGSSFSNVFNLAAKLERWDYSYRTSAEQTLENIRKGKSGCAFVTADDGENYFVVYESLNTNDWTAVYIVPETGASENSSTFMTAVIRTVLILAVIVMMNVVGLLIFSHINSTKQQEKINEQLQRAVEAEHRANDAKTRFLSSMSHDIRTPMNAIIGMTSLAQKHIDDKLYVVDCLSKIHLASDHLLTLINDILDISKIESGKMTLSPAPFSVADTINNMFNIISPQAKAKNQTLNVYINLIPYEYLTADELRLNQIFINIISNAIKYTPEEGKITVNINEELIPNDHEHVRLHFTVEDTGIGMSEEFMENMYSTFARATDSRVNKIQGTGLGLAICKQLVDMMNGTIECQSEVGKGTKFSITLDLLTAEQPDGNYRLTDMRLLLVDDDDMFLSSAAELIREMDAQVDIAHNGNEAVGITSKLCESGQTYSAILMDWKMTGLDGIETLKEIHSTVDADVPIILISAYDSTDIEQIALSAGAVGFIRKPFFKTSLFEQMSRYIDIKQEAVITMEEEKNTGTGLEGMNVLIAEDIDLNWEIAHEILDMSEINTERAENGQICVDRLNAAKDGEFDVVLMDIQMPVMDGKTAARTIRASEREYLQNIPIIAMTADAFIEDINACLEAGMNSHLSKPIDFDKLFSELRKINAAKKKNKGIKK